MSQRGSAPRKPSVPFKRETLDWFLQNGCELTRPNRMIFLGVFQASNGEPCAECNCKDTCPAWKKRTAP